MPLGLFWPEIIPPCDSIILLDKYKPRPVPEKDFEANLEKSFGIISESIPVPVSVTVTITRSSFFSETMFIFPPSSPRLNSVNLRELSKRLEITRPSLILSASTKITSSFGSNEISMSGCLLFSFSISIWFRYSSTLFCIRSLMLKRSLFSESVWLSILETSNTSSDNLCSLLAFLFPLHYDANLLFLSVSTTMSNIEL